MGDYRMTSILNPAHFGNMHHAFSLAACLTSLCMVVTDPHWWVLHLDCFRAEYPQFGLVTAWMWHIGGIGEKPEPNPIAKLLWQVYKADHSKKYAIQSSSQ